MKNISLSKITRPRMSRIAERERLFLLLDEGLKKPVTWVSAPAGSGKTTLVASWLDARAGTRPPPTIWYQVEEGDQDLATFFYYMGLAAKKATPRYKRPLPLLTPEYLQGIPTFTRRYFEELFGRISKSVGAGLKPAPTNIVLDNYQDAPLQSAFHEMIANALEVIPEGVNVIVISRGEPPAQLSRLMANNKIHLLGWDEIRFTIEETSALMDAHGRKLTEESQQQLYETTEGWAAGLVLMMESARRGGFETSPHLNTQCEVFDYFASEIFNKSEKVIQDLLLKTAFLPKIDSAAAERLTGIESAAQILEGLSKDHYFTQRHMQAFQYHPLFREFLLMRARNTFSQAELALTKRNAAELLTESGQIEDAVQLFSDAGDWEGATRLILSHAQTMVTQGRSRALEEWISGMPGEIVENSSWLLYWFGICRLAYNPAEARGYFEKAYALFKKEKELSGLFLSWASIIDTFVYEWGDFKPLDHWIEEMEGLIADNPGFPSSEIEVRVAAGMLSAMSNRQPWRADLPLWAERVQNIVLASRSVPLQVALGNQLLFYYLWFGDFSKIAVVIDALRHSGSLKGYDPLTRQNWYVMEATYSWFVADLAACKRAIADGLRNAENSGIHLLTPFLLAQGVFGGLSLGDPPTAESSFEKMSLIYSPRIGDNALYLFQSLSMAWLHRDFKKAAEHGKLAVKICEEIGWQGSLIACLNGLAVTYYDAGLFDEADACIARAMELTRGMFGLKFAVCMNGARFAFDRGREKEGIALIEQGLAVGAKCGLMNTPMWNDDNMSRLCAKALEHGVEVEYVQWLIKKRGLVHATPVDNWPYPIKIYTLGRFEIMKDGKPIQFSGKVQKKPLEMLKAIIELGGEDVPVQELSEKLWPEADGDMAHQSFKFTLHRLRKLFDIEKAVMVHGGKVTIDRRYCWIDALATQSEPVQ